MSWGIWGGIAVACLLTLGAWSVLGGRTSGIPARMILSTGADKGSPVIPVELKINDANVAGPPVALFAGWRDTHGSGRNLVALSPPGDGNDQISFQVGWVELFTGRGYRTATQLPLDSFDVHRLSEPHLRIIILFGRNGELQIRTFPRDGGAGESRQIFQTCAERAPELDKDYTDPDNGAYRVTKALSFRGAPQIPSACPDSDD